MVVTAVCAKGRAGGAAAEAPVATRPRGAVWGKAVDYTAGCYFPRGSRETNDAQTILGVARPLSHAGSSCCMMTVHIRFLRDGSVRGGPECVPPRRCPPVLTSRLLYSGQWRSFRDLAATSLPLLRAAGLDKTFLFLLSTALWSAQTLSGSVMN
ncbi:hypothetical protein E2C01_066875 [Portunus trituberculatus]|uniref:Uncharacterized protein n=1 Tax=Portunus trituberculatus TaxID=210409 RepID=A0A5B7HR14_PORTR|nr:hypothetical protein [Portunus trituberculatus]